MSDDKASWWKIVVGFIGDQEWAKQTFENFVSELEQIDGMEVFSAFIRNWSGFVLVKGDEEILRRFKKEKDRIQRLNIPRFDFYEIAAIDSKTMTTLKELDCLRHFDNE